MQAYCFCRPNMVFGLHFISLVWPKKPVGAKKSAQCHDSHELLVCDGEAALEAPTSPQQASGTMIRWRHFSADLGDTATV